MVNWYFGLARGGYISGHAMWTLYCRSVSGLKAPLLNLKARVDVGSIFEHERELWRDRQAGS